MPPRMPMRKPQARSKGYDPTVSIAAASVAKTTINAEANNQNQAQEQKKDQGSSSNDDLKKLIETLKNKLAGSTPVVEKKAPPAPRRSVWNRSVQDKPTTSNWSPKPAYTLLTRISNHEKVPVKATKQAEVTLNALPHSFLYKPGADGIKIDKVSVKPGRQVTMG